MILGWGWVSREQGERGNLGKYKCMDGVRRSIISKDVTEKNAEDIELWRSKISLR